MSGRESAEVKAAMALVDSGETRSKAARRCGIERSTLVRALARRALKLALANGEAAEDKLPIPEDV